MLRQTVLFAVTALSLSAQALSQTNFVEQRPVCPNFYVHSSTLQEGVERGFADMLRADGSCAYDKSLAAGHFEDARAKWLKNRQASVQQYFELRQLNQDYRRRFDGKSAVKGPAAQAKVSRGTSVASPAPVLASGQIEWPAALQEADAAGARYELQRIFTLRAEGRDTRCGTPEHRQGCEAISQIQAELQRSIRTLPTAEYVAAKKTLQSLKQELALRVQQPLLSQN
jgi:hypothetical protein